jgi:hypothetical protein
MYEKKPFTIDDQVHQLKDRGLFISESDNIQHYLSHIS